MRRYATHVVLLVAFALGFPALCQTSDSWASPGQNRLRQTVPTRTPVPQTTATRMLPTPQPATPTPAQVEPTPTLAPFPTESDVPPTATWTAAATSKASTTATLTHTPQTAATQAPTATATLGAAPQPTDTAAPTPTSAPTRSQPAIPNTPTATMARSPGRAFPPLRACALGALLVVAGAILFAIYRIAGSR